MEFVLLGIVVFACLACYMCGHAVGYNSALNDVATNLDSSYEQFTRIVDAMERDMNAANTPSGEYKREGE